MKSSFCFALLMGLGVIGVSGCEPGPAPEQEGGEFSTSSAGISEGLADRLLAEHNRFRSFHGAPALSWSSPLEVSAQSWANACSMSHSGNAGIGENLAWGWGGTNGTPEAVVESWYTEWPNYSLSNPVFTSAASHFTQVVWISTTAVGCGYAKCGDQDYWVCQYSPQGNISGAFDQNVTAAVPRWFCQVNRDCLSGRCRNGHCRIDGHL